MRLDEEHAALFRFAANVRMSLGAAEVAMVDAGSTDEVVLDQLVKVLRSSEVKTQFFLDTRTALAMTGGTMPEVLERLRLVMTSKSPAADEFAKAIAFRRWVQEALLAPDGISDGACAELIKRERIELNDLRIAVHKAHGIPPGKDVAHLIEALSIVEDDRTEIGRLRGALTSLLGVDTTLPTEDLLKAAFRSADSGRPLTSFVELEDDKHAQQEAELDDQVEALQSDNEALRIRLDDALHASYRLARVACDISGADMQAVKRAADRCGCDHEDSPETPPRREWREG